MIYRLDINYLEEERYFLEVNDCEIISEIKLSKTNFSDKEIPRRMIKYGGQYIAEIVDDETEGIVWDVLSNWKGILHFSSNEQLIVKVICSSTDDSFSVEDWVDAFEWISISLICENCGEVSEEWLDTETM